MAPQTQLQAYLTAQIRYEATQGNVDHAILTEFAAELHQLWSRLSEEDKRLAFLRLLNQRGARAGADEIDILI